MRLISLEPLSFSSINIDFNHVTLGQDSVVNQIRVPDKRFLLSFHILPGKSCSDKGTWLFQPSLAIYFRLGNIYTIL